MEHELTVVGKSTPRLDGLEKVTGRAIFGQDLRRPGMLIGKVLRSRYPHARILSVDTSRAEALPGVKAVVTGREAPPGRYGAAVKDETVLAVDRVRYLGEAVAAVAAVDEETAERALGFTLYEEVLFQGGRTLNPHLQDYRLPRAVDMPSVEAIFLEEPKGDGPYGSRGLGEAPNIPTPPAVANAIHNATGQRPLSC